MADLEFFFDPVCPWAWITSRWVTEVQGHRGLDVVWRFASLAIINEESDADNLDEDKRAIFASGLAALRVMDEVRLRHSNDEVAALYTEVGMLAHRDQRRSELVADPVGFLKEVLGRASLPIEYAAEALNVAHDEAIRESTELALERTGRGVGTPILTFRPGRPDEGSFFGPVIATIPRGEVAVRLWDAVELVATTGGMIELKRVNKAKPRFD